MAGREHMEQGFKLKRVVVAIPASNASSGSIMTWADLAGFANTDKAKCLAVYCSGWLPDSSTQRGGLYVSDTNTSLTAAEYIPAGQEYYRPATQDHINSYPTDPLNAGFNALAIFVMLATEGAV